MTPDEELYVMRLEDALYGAHGGIEFLHGCLTDPGTYRYAYPDMTVRQIASLAELLPERPRLCVHSVRDPRCESCAWATARYRRRAELELIAADKETTDG